MTIEFHFTSRHEFKQQYEVAVLMIRGKPEGQQMMKALATPVMKQRFFENGVAAAPQQPVEFVKFIAAERAKWKKAVALSGAKPE